ncbi:hypothetical protein SKAU_G00289850 [Synaphobranchus kaupii]|uniref:Uncharacterized protein n=1 Tax=Synaphobranchus kaupii TaxID=118154 RepID=A0A9Q1ETJ1_SYNKA|nr:hypothetical protein SKAU_G00289850 [Synaphobranchus kaupii]
MKKVCTRTCPTKRNRTRRIVVRRLRALAMKEKRPQQRHPVSVMLACMLTWTCSTAPSTPEGTLRSLYRLSNLGGVGSIAVTLRFFPAAAPLACVACKGRGYICRTQAERVETGDCDK